MPGTRPPAYVSSPLPQTSPNLGALRLKTHTVRPEGSPNCNVAPCMARLAPGVPGATRQDPRREGIPAPPPRSSCDAISHIRSSAGAAECLFGILAMTSEGIPRSAAAPRACGTRPRLRTASPPRGPVLIGAQSGGGSRRGAGGKHPRRGRPCPPFERFPLYSPSVTPSCCPDERVQGHPLRGQS